MRGRLNPQSTMLAFVDLEERVPVNHPSRTIKRFADRVLTGSSPTFDAIYRAGGRPSIPPERLLKASLLICLYSVRSERAFLRRTGLPAPLAFVPRYDLAGARLRPIHVQQEPWPAAATRLALQFFDQVVRQADALWLLSDEHFTVDGTLIAATVSLKGSPTLAWGERLG